MNLKLQKALEGFFDKHKALIITVLSMSILLLLLYNIHLRPSSGDLAGTIVELEHLVQEEETPQEELEQEESQTAPRSPSNIRTHQAFNQENQEQESNFEQRLNEIFQRNASQQERQSDNETESSLGDATLSTPTDKQQERSDGDGTSSEVSHQTGSIRNSSISFSLVGRMAREMPNPVYTCDAQGKIVINITVDREGTVIKTAINKSSSNSSNQCLEEKALEYASRARFSSQPGRDKQIGTITYYFQG